MDGNGAPAGYRPSVVFHIYLVKEQRIPCPDPGNGVIRDDWAHRLPETALCPVCREAYNGLSKVKESTFSSTMR